MEITFYGFIYALAIIVYFFIVRNYLKLKNKDPSLIFSAGLYPVIGLIIGARMVYVFYYYPLSFIQNPIEILYIWKGGFSFHGGLLGLIIGGYIFTKRNKLDFFEIGDIIALPAGLFLSIGRIANFFNSEIYGKITNLPWCVKFKKIVGCRHPSQLYESISDLFIFLVLLSLKIKTKLKSGILMFLFLSLYSLLRFFLDFLRVYNNYYLGLANAQYLDLITFIVSLYFLIKISRTKNTQ